MKFNEKGEALPDPAPVAIPAGFKKPLSIQEEMRRMIRGEVSAHAQSQGFETLQEANDFEIADDNDPTDQATSYELMGSETFDGIPPYRSTKQNTRNGPPPRDDPEDFEDGDDDDERSGERGDTEDDDSGTDGDERSGHEDSRQNRRVPQKARKPPSKANRARARGEESGRPRGRKR